MKPFLYSLHMPFFYTILLWRQERIMACLCGKSLTGSNLLLISFSTFWNDLNGLYSRGPGHSLSCFTYPSFSWFCQQMVAWESLTLEKPACAEDLSPTLQQWAPSSPAHSLHNTARETWCCCQLFPFFNSWIPDTSSAVCIPSEQLWEEKSSGLGLHLRRKDQWGSICI